MSFKGHIFALYYAQLPNEKVEGNFFLNDSSLIQRLTRILRATQGQECILFNKIAHAHVLLQTFDKKGIHCTFLDWQLNKQITPLVDWWLPLLDKGDWEEALSFLTILGATTIQPLITQKVHRTKLFDHELERLERLMIAAAEQSKQFSLPTIKKMITLDEALKQHTQETSLIFFDVAGKSANEVLNALKDTQPTHITCMVGPEGDLTDEEKERIRAYGFQFCALAPSVLRSAHAAFLGMGIIRSFIRSKEHHQV